MSVNDWKKLVDAHIDAAFPKSAFVDKAELMPKMPDNIQDWMNEIRTIVDGKERGTNMLVAPFWNDIYNDDFWDVMVVAGRQVFKTTFCTDVLGYYATTKKGAECCYVTHDETSLSAFSNQRMRVGTFLENQALKIFAKQSGTMGSVGELALKNNSTIYMTTDQHGYKHVEGKSLAICVLDEAQYQDVEYLSKLEQTMRITRGKLRVLGIGGESGSPYERMWNRTDQREWHYKHKDWRDKLEFNDEGLVIDEYMRDVLQGTWVSRVPDNTLFHGYHVPQSLSCLVPISIHDAVEKYKTAAKFSIESQEREYPSSIFKTHVLGTFHRATRRPVTRETVLRCMNKKIALLKPDEVKEIVKERKDAIVSFGVDFGSGPANSSTVACVLIQFKDDNRYQIAWIEKRPQENQLDQARYLNALFKSYNCEMGMGDLGYGAIQVKVIQDGGADRLTGELFTGVGSNKFYGCHSIASDTKPFQIHEGVSDEHGDEVGKISIDKTASIQEFIDVLDRKIPDPDNPKDPKKARTQLIIPFKDDFETEWLINDFTSITRKDLAKIEDIDITDPRQRPRKEFNHPRDSVMAIIYAYQAIKQKDASSWYWVSA
mgnify:FL=1